jgi:hypothetical protein
MSHPSKPERIISVRDTGGDSGEFDAPLLFFTGYKIRFLFNPVALIFNNFQNGFTNSIKWKNLLNPFLFRILGAPFPLSLPEQLEDPLHGKTRPPVFRKRETHPPKHCLRGPTTVRVRRCNGLRLRHSVSFSRGLMGRFRFQFVSFRLNLFVISLFMHFTLYLFVHREKLH